MLAAVLCEIRLHRSAAATALCRTADVTARDAARKSRDKAAAHIKKIQVEQCLDLQDKAYPNLTALSTPPPPDELESAMGKMRVVSSALHKSLAGAKGWETYHARCKFSYTYVVLENTANLAVPAPHEVPASSAGVVIVTRSDTGMLDISAADYASPAEGKRETSAENENDSCKDVQAVRNGLIK